MNQLFAFTMPKWGIEMTEGVVAQWMVTEGEAFKKGEVVIAVETEKIVNDIEAEFDGVLVKVVAEEGETYQVGALLGVMGPKETTENAVNDFIQSFKPAVSQDFSEHNSDGQADTIIAELDAESPTIAFEVPQGVRISPSAHDLASRRGIDLKKIQGSGRKNRIQLQDVEQFLRFENPVPAPAVDNKVDMDTPGDGVLATPIAKQVALGNAIELGGISGTGKDGRVRVRDLPQPSGGGLRVPFSAMRSKIAERLTSSYQTVPHYYLETEARMDDLLALRETFNQNHERKASINDFIIKASALALKKHPKINVHVGEDHTIEFDQVNIAIAVALEGGLITPVLSNADKRPMDDLSLESKRLVEGAQQGTLSFADYSGGTFTVSNLGMYGVTRFTAIINAPQAAILSVGAVENRVLAIAGRLKLGAGLTLTLGCDHRVIDGALGGLFLADLKQVLEDPDQLI